MYSQHRLFTDVRTQQGSAGAHGLGSWEHDTTASRAEASPARIQPHGTQAGERQGGQPGSTKSPDQQEHPQRGGRSKDKPGSGAMRMTRIRLSPVIAMQGHSDKARLTRTSQEQQDTTSGTSRAKLETSTPPSYFKQGLKAPG